MKPALTTSGSTFTWWAWARVTTWGLTGWTLAMSPFWSMRYQKGATMSRCPTCRWKAGHEPCPRPEVPLSS